MIRLKPQLHDRVWGGNRLVEGPEQIGEVWVVCAGDRIENGALHGKTLDELVHEHGKWLLRSRREHHTHHGIVLIQGSARILCSTLP